MADTKKCRTCKLEKESCDYETAVSRSCLECTEASRLRRSISSQARWAAQGYQRVEVDTNPLANFWLRRLWL